MFRSYGKGGRDFSDAERAFIDNGPKKLRSERIELTALKHLCIKLITEKNAALYRLDAAKDASLQESDPDRYLQLSEAYDDAFDRMTEVRKQHENLEAEYKLKLARYSDPGSAAT